MFGNFFLSQGVQLLWYFSFDRRETLLCAHTLSHVYAHMQKTIEIVTVFFFFCMCAQTCWIWQRIWNCVFNAQFQLFMCACIDMTENSSINNQSNSTLHSSSLVGWWVECHVLWKMLWYAIRITKVFSSSFLFYRFSFHINLKNRQWCSFWKYIIFRII